MSEVEKARQSAIEWQQWQSEQSMSWFDMAMAASYFRTLADKFPELEDEFKENGII